MLKLFRNAPSHRKEIDAVFKEALAQRDNGDYKKAATLLEKALAEDSENEVIKLKLWQVRQKLKAAPNPPESTVQTFDR